MTYDIILDVGGTQIKAAALDQYGHLTAEMRRYPAKAQGSATEILDQLAYAIQQAMGGAGQPSGIAMTFPGPFDYEQGISYMRGLQKYEAIYGLSIPDELKKRLSPYGLHHLPFRFLHDMEAFARGACLHTEASHYDRVMYLCIGTGAGSAFTENGVLIKDGQYGLPQNGWIHRTPMRGQTIDDLISARGLSEVARVHCGQPLTGIELSQLAARSDADALHTWHVFGESVKEAIVPFLAAFQANALMLGGQIAKALPYFGAPINHYCKQNDIALLQNADSSYCAMQGLQAALHENA